MARNLGIAIAQLIAKRKAAKKGAYYTPRSGIVESPYEDADIEEWNEFESLSYDNQTNKLSFVLRHYTKKPKITRYITRNYVRTPIYGDVSVSSRIEKKIDKVINPLRFTNKEILELGIPYEDEIKIVETIGIIPKWLQRDLDEDETLTAINDTSNKLRSYNDEKLEYQFKKTDYPEKRGKFWLRLAFCIFTLGLSFIKYRTKKQAIKNKEMNIENVAYNNKYKVEIDKKNAEILKDVNIANDATNKELKQLQKKLNDIQSRDITKYYEKSEEGWMPLLKASTFGYPELAGKKKGVYIIWNKTKNKYYVGQSKDLQRRMNQHFKNGKANEMKFAKDFFDGDEWAYKYKFLNTKDELDSEEKKWTEYYDSFNNGYNNTGGNY